MSTDAHSQPTGLTRTEILLPEEVAEILRSSRTKVLSEARKGRLRVLRFGKERRFLREDVEDYIRRLCEDEQPGPGHRARQAELL